MRQTGRRVVRRVSVVVLLLVVAAWGLSYAHPRPVKIGGLSLKLVDGAVLMDVMPPGMMVMFDGSNFFLRTIWWTDWSFKAARVAMIGANRVIVTTAVYALPLWIPAAGLSGILIAVRRDRHGPGRCAVCGYDLSATPARCPECGAEAAAARVAGSGAVPGAVSGAVPGAVPGAGGGL